MNTPILAESDECESTASVGSVLVLLTREQISNCPMALTGHQDCRHDLVAKRRNTNAYDGRDIVLLLYVIQLDEEHDLADDRG